MDIGVVGAGYVGLVTGTCLAEMGNTVCISDIAKDKIASVKQSKCPHFEPGLDEILKGNIGKGRLSFTTSTNEMSKDKKAIFLAVGIPMSEDGAANMQYMIKAAEEVRDSIPQEAIIITKSTVPVGTNKQ